jgi:hypothetical protein
LFKLGLRAFALPLAVFLVAGLALARWHVGEDWVGMVALAFAALCGWYATRRLRSGPPGTAQTK